jgi:hypothetical protein
MRNIEFFDIFESIKTIKKKQKTPCFFVMVMFEV